MLSTQDTTNENRGTGQYSSLSWKGGRTLLCRTFVRYYYTGRATVQGVLTCHTFPMVKKTKPKKNQTNTGASHIHPAAYTRPQTHDHVKTERDML